MTVTPLTYVRRPISNETLDRIRTPVAERRDVMLPIRWLTTS